MATPIPMAIIVFGVQATGVMADGAIMFLGVLVTAAMVTVVIVGIADSAFCGQKEYFSKVPGLKRRERNR